MLDAKLTVFCDKSIHYCGCAIARNVQYVPSQGSCKWLGPSEGTDKLIAHVLHVKNG